MKLLNKIIVITGASSGIGKQTAMDLGKGNTVILLARNEERLKDISAAIQKRSPASEYYVCDVRQERQVKAIVEKIIRKHGHIDVLVNNAGYGRVYNFLQTPDDVWKDMFDTNYFGLVSMTRYVLPHMLKRKCGHIVNIGSVVSKIAVPGMSTYCSTKHAVMALTESLYYELKGTGVNLSIVMPGKTATHFFDDESFKNESKRSDKYNTPIPPVKISKAISEVIENNRFEKTVPGKFNLIYFLKYNFGPFYRWMMGRLY